MAAACHQVAKGQELTDSYGPTFMEEERDDRRKRLFEDYRFPCRCLACIKKWPCTPDLAATIFEVQIAEIFSLKNLILSRSASANFWSQGTKQRLIRP